MRLTPIEIRQHRFNMRVRGYDTHEVQAFLETVVEDFEEVVRENAKLRRDTERLTRELEAYRGREQNIQSTLTTAQKVVEELKRTAMKEAEIIVGEAKIRGEKLLVDARARAVDLQGEIDELGHLRSRVGAELRRTLEGYGSLIDAYETSRRERAEAGTGARPPVKESGATS